MWLKNNDIPDKQMGAPAGNQNSANRGIWRQAIIRALDKRGASRADALDELADKLITLVAAGELQAIKEFGDRLDGKAPQAITGDADNPIQLVGRIERVIVENAKNSDA